MGPAASRRRSANVFSGLGRHAGRTALQRPPRPRRSPLRVYEATRWSLVAVDATKLIAPILMVSGALDILTPPETGAALATLYGATHQLEPAHGHNVLLGEGARRIAEGRDRLGHVRQACSRGSDSSYITHRRWVMSAWTRA